MNIPINLSLSLLRGASLSVGIRVTGLGLAFIGQVLVSRLSGAEAYGIFMYCFAWLGLVLVFTRSGTDEALVRFLPQATIDKRLKHALVDWAFTRTATPSWLLFLAAILTAAACSLEGEAEYARIIATAAPFIPVLTLLWLYQARLRAAERTLAAFLPNEIARPLVFILLLLLCMLFEITPAATELLILSLLATTLAVGLMMIFARDPLHVRRPRIPEEIRSWTRTANHFFLIALCLAGTATFDIMVVGSLMPAEQTGHYAAAQRLSSFAGFGLIAVNLIIAPMLPPLLNRNGGHAEAERLLRFGARLATVFVLLTGLCMWLLRDPMLGLFGDGFVAAEPVLGILLLAQLVLAVSGSQITLMMMSGNERPALTVLGFCSALNLLLCVTLTLGLGPTGAAVAMLVTNIVQQVGLTLHSRRQLKIRADCF
ncbi:MAG: oligosaccharide flippase family protein [Pseudomonadales bacterium]